MSAPPVAVRFDPAVAVRTVAAWAITLLIFFPLGWMLLTSFKTELQAIAVPPLFIFEPTFGNFAEVQTRSQRYVSTVLLIKALGGGWTPDDAAKELAGEPEPSAR